MKKFLLVLMMVSLMVLPLAACGGGSGGSDSGDSGTEADPLVGVYHSVAGEMMGVTLTGDDIAGFDIDIKEGGKLTLTVDGTSSNGTYSVEGDTLTVTVEGEDMTATIGEDILIFDDMMGMGLKLTFAKEGTDAENANYASAESQAIVGSWKSTAVEDVLGNDMSDKMAVDACTAEFTEDGTGTIKIVDKTFGPYPFVNMSGMFVFKPEDDSDLPLLWMYEDGELDITYTADDGQFNFVMEKQ